MLTVDVWASQACGSALPEPAKGVPTVPAGTVEPTCVVAMATRRSLSTFSVVFLVVVHVVVTGMFRFALANDLGIVNPDSAHVS